MRTTRRGILLVLPLLLLLLLALWLWYRAKHPPRPPTRLVTASGVETSEFQPYDTVMFDAVGLQPRNGYVIQIARADGRVVRALRVSSDSEGRISETVLWYDVGAEPCQAAPIPGASATDLSSLRRARAEPEDAALVPGRYTLRVMLGQRMVRSVSFNVTEALHRPALYAADSRGCPRAGFIIGEEDVWVVGKNFPAGSLVRVWAVPARSEWPVGTLLEDATKMHPTGRPPVLELAPGETGFTRLLWPRDRTSLGSYDLVAEVVKYPFGAYRPQTTAEATNLVSHLQQSGFVVQRRPGEAEPLEMNLAGTRRSTFTYRDTFLTSEDVFVGVDPTVQPAYINQTADVYVVADRPAAQWTAGTPLVDVSNGGIVEQITVQFVCGNCWATPVWIHPLTPGKYDVVLDFNRNGRYDPGVDLIDSLDAVGFTVADVRVESIAFNYSGSNAITIYDESAGANVAAPEFSAAATQAIKPAAWVQGGSHSVRVTFQATASVSSAEIWAEIGLGGLASSASPVPVSFSGGQGTGTFNVNGVPTMAGKHQFDWDWKCRISGVTQPMGATGRHLVYTTLAAPISPVTPPPLHILDYSCTWASGATTKAQVADQMLSNGFVGHYTWNMDCHRLASDFVRLVGIHGVAASQHNWASRCFIGGLGDMDYQRTRVFDAVGPTWGNQQVEWCWHQWAEAEGAQRDAAAGASLAGTWGDYEDYLFTHYREVTGVNPRQTQWKPNQSGQSVGCEAPAHRDYTASPPLYSWRGPDR